MDEDLEELGYYDLLAELGAPYFHWGGIAATKRLVELCNVDRDKAVLAVGCGVGYSVCYVAKHYGCKVVGIDVAERAIAKASQRAREWHLGAQTQFLVADAHRLPFTDNSFDIVLTEFVSIFLEKEKVFKEQAGKGFEDVTGLPLVLPTPSQWTRWFGQAGLRNIQTERVVGNYRLAEYSAAVGGPFELQRLLTRLFYYWMFNRRFRQQALKIGRVRHVLMTNRKTKPYVGALLCVGQT
jgi:SAM-dependent methyltransferase